MFSFLSWFHLKNVWSIKDGQTPRRLLSERLVGSRRFIVRSVIIRFTHTHRLTSPGPREASRQRDELTGRPPGEDDSQRRSDSLVGDSAAHPHRNTYKRKLTGSDTRRQLTITTCSEKDGTMSLNLHFLIFCYIFISN